MTEGSDSRIRLEPARRRLTVNIAPSNRVLLIASRPLDPRVERGIVGRAISAEHEMWFLLAPHDAQPFTIARLLAILLIDASQHNLKPRFMPNGFASARILSSGETVHGVNKRLPPWILREIDRIASVLLKDQPEYVSAVENGLRKKEGLFQRIPASFKEIRDPDGVVLLGPPPAEVEVDVSGSGGLHFLPSERQRNRLVEDDYRRNRYMAHLSRERLGRRIADVLGNLHMIGNDGKIRMDEDRPTNLCWQERFWELAVETTIRYGPYPAGWEGLLPKEELPGSLKSAQLSRGRRLPSSKASPGRILVRYDRREYIDEAFEKGRIYIGPISRVSDPSLNPAIRDDEELSPEIDINMFWPGLVDTESFSRPLPDGARGILRLAMATNFYALCLTTRLSNRLLLDFSKDQSGGIGDAALVIYDPDTFLRRLDKAFRVHRPDTRTVADHVRYYDPLHTSPSEIRPVLSKHFRYSYQQEFRVAWIPNQPAMELEHVYVEIGPLTGIAEIFEPVRPAGRIEESS
jgi:hypothetical protein